MGCRESNFPQHKPGLSGCKYFYCFMESINNYTFPFMTFFLAELVSPHENDYLHVAAIASDVSEWWVWPARCGVTIVWDNAYCQWDIVLICVLANRIKPTVMAGKVITVGFQRARRCEDAPQSIWMGKFWNETQIEWATGARYNICDLGFRPLLRLGWSKTSSSAHLSHQNI